MNDHLTPDQKAMFAQKDDEHDDAPIGDGDDEPAGRAVDVELDLG